MGMLFNSPATLAWVATVHNQFAKAWPTFTASPTARTNWSNLFRRLGSPNPSYDTLVSYMALKHPDSSLDLKWKAWLHLMDTTPSAPPSWATTIGGWIADAIQNPAIDGVEFHPVQSPYIYAVYTDFPDNANPASLIRNITIYTLTWDGQNPQN